MKFDKILLDKTIFISRAVEKRLLSIFGTSLSFVLTSIIKTQNAPLMLFLIPVVLTQFEIVLLILGKRKISDQTK